MAKERSCQSFSLQLCCLLPRHHSSREWGDGIRMEGWHLYIIRKTGIKGRFVQIIYWTCLWASQLTAGRELDPFYDWWLDATSLGELWSFDEAFSMWTKFFAFSCHSFSDSGTRRCQPRPQCAYTRPGKTKKGLELDRKHWGGWGRLGSKIRLCSDIILSFHDTLPLAAVRPFIHMPLFKRWERISLIKQWVLLPRVHLVLCSRHQRSRLSVEASVDVTFPTEHLTSIERSSASYRRKTFHYTLRDGANHLTHVLNAGLKVYPEVVLCDVSVWHAGTCRQTIPDIKTLDSCFLRRTTECHECHLHPVSLYLFRTDRNHLVSLFLHQ